MDTMLKGVKLISWPQSLFILGFGAVAVLATVAWFGGGGGKSPRHLADPIPFVFNSFQFALNNRQFMNRVSKVLENVDLAKFYLFSTPVFLVSGPKNIQTIFSRTHRIGIEDLWVQTVFPVLYGMSTQDVRLFAEDRSGRDPKPAPSAEHVPRRKRYWFKYGHIHSEYLSKPQYFRPLANIYLKNMNNALDKTYAEGEWVLVNLKDFCRQQVATQSIEMLFGPKIFDICPDLLNSFWSYDNSLLYLLILPKWLARGSYRARERYFSMVRQYVSVTFWNNHSEKGYEQKWENEGALILQKILEWVRDSELHDEAAIGTLGVLIFALISNTIPTTMWMIIEVVKDPSLLEEVRAEVNSAYVVDPELGTPKLDLDKLVKLPLLQSIFMETLRLRTNFNLMRCINEDFTIDGVTLHKGSMLQASMLTAHYDETVWGNPNHPASEFWAERHSRQAETEPKRVFAAAGRPTSYFPFGGGHQICPGRHLAKSEILTTIALLITKFDIEVVGWTKTNLTCSDRPAQNDQRYSGVGSMPPDRDLKMRWKRVR